jgi:hypothetical protein
MAEHTLDQTVTVADANPALLHAPRRMLRLSRKLGRAASCWAISWSSRMWTA